MHQRSVLTRNNVHVVGQGTRPMLFVHGYGWDQQVWRYVWPAFAEDHRIVLVDLVGSGRSVRNAYDPERYATLDQYTDDLAEVCDELGVRDGVFVGHSIASMMGVRLANRRPELFSELVMIGPSARYIDDEGYHGGASLDDIEGLLAALATDYESWVQHMAPALMGRPDRPELSAELATSFQRTDPEVAANFARVTFLSDNRVEISRLRARTLILQAAADVVAPTEVGQYLHRQIADNELVLLNATGHCPHLSAPDEVIAAIRSFLATSVRPPGRA